MKTNRVEIQRVIAIIRSMDKYPEQAFEQAQDVIEQTEDLTIAAVCAHVKMLATTLLSK